MTKFGIIEIGVLLKRVFQNSKFLTARTKMLKFSGQVIMKDGEWQNFWIPRNRVHPKWASKD